MHASSDGAPPASPPALPSDTALAAMRQKYDEERDKRLLAQRERRAEGQTQYSALSDLAQSDARFARMLSDPWAAPDAAPFTRPPCTSDVEVLVLGAGFGGLCAGARLRQAGLEPRQIRLIDSAADVGGTWYWNRYPGAMCDVESYIYMPLLEELGVMPTLKYAKQPELLEHSRRIARHFGLYENALLGTRLTGLAWDESHNPPSWRVRTDNARDAFHARCVIFNFGTFTTPKLPAIAGLERFRGHQFHTSRWDYGYTGGSPRGEEPLRGLRGKRVALVGTGATAVQVLPELAKHCAGVTVFQRTPSSVDVRDQRATDPQYAREHMAQPGWQQRRMKNFIQMTQTPAFGVEDAVRDGWTKIFANLQQKFLSQSRAARKAGDRSGVQMVTRLLEEADYAQMESVRGRCDAVVRDPETAAALKPYYRQFCKRPCFHDEYLQAFNRPGVELVHTDGRGIECVTERGIASRGGVETEVDVIVWATGFDTAYSAADLATRKVGVDLRGRGGVTLSQKWEAGPRTLNGINTHGFPNLWMLNAPQATFTTNFVHQLDEIAKHAAHAIALLSERHGPRAFVEPTAEAEAAYSADVYARSGRGQKFLKGCTPGYYNGEGTIEVGKTHSTVWGAPLKYFKRLRTAREEGRVFEGMAVSVSSQ